MKKKVIFGLVLATALTVSAVAWARVEVVPVETTMNGVIHNGFVTGEGTFEAFVSTGKARVVVPGGKYRDSAFAAGETVHVTRVLSPNKKLGELFLKSVARLGPDGAEGTWTITGGSGAYEKVKGQGTMRATIVSHNPDGSVTVEETFVGQLIIEDGS